MSVFSPVYQALFSVINEFYKVMGHPHSTPLQNWSMYIIVPSRIWCTSGCWSKLGTRLSMPGVFSRFVAPGRKFSFRRNHGVVQQNKLWSSREKSVGKESRKVRRYPVEFYHVDDQCVDNDYDRRLFVLPIFYCWLMLFPAPFDDWLIIQSMLYPVKYFIIRGK